MKILCGAVMKSSAWEAHWAHNSKAALGRSHAPILDLVGHLLERDPHLRRDDALANVLPGQRVVHEVVERFLDRLGIRERLNALKVIHIAGTKVSATRTGDRGVATAKVTSD